MRKRIKQVSVLVNPSKSGAEELMPQLKTLFRECGVDAVWQRDRKSAYQSPDASGPLAREGDHVVLAVGGDGTMLQAARRTRGTGVPILGINTGSLGFLTSISGIDAVSQVKRILRGEYVPDRRATLDCRHWRGGKLIRAHWALNEAALTRGTHSHLVSIDLHIGDELATSYACDGLILATPTGSTAYSVAAGGPLLSTHADVFVLTPICAHSLTNRPLVIADREAVQFRLPDVSPELQLHTDGIPCGPVRAGDILEFSRSVDQVTLLRLPEMSYYSILRQKLHWSGAV